MMMQPYRLALTPVHSRTCLDPPRHHACDAPPNRRLRLDVFAGAMLALASVTGIAAASVTARRGHVEIAPTALTHAVKKPTPKRPSQPAHRDVPISRPRPVRAWLGGAHDPADVLARARQAAEIGLDVTVVEVWLGGAAKSADLWPVNTLPVRDHEHVTGLEIQALPSDSPLGKTGVVKGDQLLGVDGYRLDDGSFADIDTLAIEKRGWVVAEIARGEHHIALSIHWPSNATHISQVKHGARTI
jgi:hypothetical protein